MYACLPSLGQAQPEAGIIYPKINDLHNPKLNPLDPSKIEIFQGDSKPFYAEGIKRFLVTNPEVTLIEQISNNELQITAVKAGETFLHIWDIRGRITVKIEVIPRVFLEIARAKERVKKEEQKAQTFKFHYLADENSFHVGPKFGELERTSLVVDQKIGLTGPTPYGDLDSYATIRKSADKLEATYITLGLLNGDIYDFRNFDVRLIDYSVGFQDLVLPQATLRGAYLYQRNINDVLDYTAIWGRERRGLFGAGIRPGLEEWLDSYLTGINFNYHLPFSSYRFSYFAGYGKDRDPILNSDGIDIGAKFAGGNTRFEGDVGYDGQTYAYMLKSGWIANALKLDLLYRNIDKEYVTIIGRVNEQGRLGTKLSADFTPYENVFIYSYVDGFRERLLPNPDNIHRYNFDYEIGTRIGKPMESNVHFYYHMADNRGTLFPRQEETEGARFTKTFQLPHKVNAFIGLQHRDSDNKDSPVSNFTNEQLSCGIQTNLFKDISLSILSELNRLNESYIDLRTYPKLFSIGIDYNHIIEDTPFSTNIRLRYENQDDTSSPKSFLTGEDSLQEEVELKYNPSPDLEAYLYGRLKYAWPVEHATSKQVEAEVRTGVRYIFDTGVQWLPRGSIFGIVFKDLNGNGQKDAGEPNIPDVVILFDEEKSTTTNKKGFYYVEKLLAREAYVSVDVSSLPRGFVMTTPQGQKVRLYQNRFSIANFGAMSVSQIRGAVFLDVNGDGRFNIGDIGIAKVRIFLDEERLTYTDNYGNFLFGKVPTGSHTIRLDLKALPLQYIPTVPVEYELELFEGVEYEYNWPVLER